MAKGEWTEHLRVCSFHTGTECIPLLRLRQSRGVRHNCRFWCKSQ
ncbi:hypothetical protein GQ607_010622 [Colletotrichum asianum]|uniref:Uncharacterized protein n=1 Tax=Colletotrichum asianum TaxID=702518 RepID=A0A8H3ZJJ5_9PEZI|nr:hypothetical protein GQ607_010622 [Colletotrichum asianum]